MNDLLATFLAIFYISLFIFVIKLIAYYLHKRKMKKLEPLKNEIDGISYYVLHKGKEVCIIGNEHKMIRSQLEKIAPLYQNDSKVISFLDGVSVLSNEYAYCINGTITFSSSRKKSEEELNEQPDKKLF